MRRSQPSSGKTFRLGIGAKPSVQVSWLRSSFRAELNSLNDSRLPDIGFESYDSMEGLIAIDRSGPPTRFGSWPGAKLLRPVYPGLLVAGTIALASTWLAQHYTAPVMLFALLFGMAFHFLHEEGRCVAGI